MSGCDRSWLELAALVVGHAGVSLALLCTYVVGKLRSTEQTDKNGGEVGGHEFHGSIPQPVEDLLTVEQLVSGDMLRHEDKAAAVLSHNPVNGPIRSVAVGVAGVEEGLFVRHGVLSKPG